MSSRTPPRTDNVVMLVEDDPDCLDAVTAGLEYAGYSVAGVTNGLEALRYLEAMPPNPRPRLILLDLMMPIMDGWQFIDHLRKRPDLASLPVVLLSAERDLAQKATELGVTGYVTKPVDLDDLLATVDHLAVPLAPVSSR